MIIITPYSKPLFLLNQDISLVAFGDRQIIAPGVHFSTTLHITSLAVGDYFTLAIDHATYRFDVVAIPDDSGLQITAGNNQTTFIADLLSNYALNKSYNITFAPGPSILITAKLPGSIFTIQPYFNNCNYPVVVTNTIPGTNEQIADNYGIAYTLEERDPINPEVYNEITSFISSGSSTIRVAIDQFLKKIIWNPPLPSFNQAPSARRPDLIRTFRAKLSERYGVIPEIKKVYSTLDFKVLKFEVPGVMAPDFDLYAYFQYAKRFLSDQPVIRRTWYNAPQFLTFFNPLPGINSFYVKVTYITADYMPVEVIPLQFTGFPQNEIFQISASPKALNLPEDVVQYSVQIGCQSPPFVDQFLINPITFNLVDQTDFGRAFIYLNSYGTWETLLSFATMKSDLKTTRVQLLNDATKSSVVDSKLTTYSVSTGRMTQAEAVALQDSLASEQFFLTGSSAFIPVVIEPGSFTIADEFQNLITVTFCYTYADQRLRDNQFNPDTIYFDKVGFTSDFKIN